MQCAIAACFGAEYFMNEQNEQNELNEQDLEEQKSSESTYSDLETASVSEQPKWLLDEQDEAAKKARFKIALFILIAGLLLGAWSTWTLFFAPKQKSKEAPIPASSATTDKEYVSDILYFMTDSIASFTSVEDRQFYIASCKNDTDEYYHYTVIYVKDEDLSRYQGYLDLWYHDDATLPEPSYITGYSALIPDDLVDYIKQGFYDYYDIIISEEEYHDYVLPIYIVVGDTKGEYKDTIWGIIALILGILLLVASVIILVSNGRDLSEVFAGDEDHRGSVLLGIIGAIIGASIGGLVWTIFGLLGYFVPIAGFIIAGLALAGYSFFCHKYEKFGAILCFILSALIILIATFMTTVFSSFSSLNDGAMGFISFADSVKITLAFVLGGEGTRAFWSDVVIGEILALVVGVFSLIKIGK